MGVLILGGTGMLGHKLYATLRESMPCKVTVRGTSSDVARYGLFCPDEVVGGVDAADYDTVRNTIQTVAPSVVVNCIGIVKQHGLAKDPQACISINALLPHQLAKTCAEAGARLIHISTDCVFAGTKGGYTEDDLTDAEDLYGRTKALGETQAANALTLRTSIIGRELSAPSGLVEWFLSNAGTTVKGFTNARFSGLTTAELSRVIQRVILAHPDLNGIYQVAADPIDKFSLLRIVRDSFGLSTAIEPDGSLKIDRTLNGSRFSSITGYMAPAWPAMIAEMAEDPTPYLHWR